MKIKIPFLTGILNAFKTIGFVLGVIINALPVALPLWMILQEKGNVIANLAIAGISFLYFLFYAITYFIDNAKVKKSKKTAKKITKLSKKIAKHVINIGVNIYVLVATFIEANIDYALVAISALAVLYNSVLFIVDIVNIASEVKKAREKKERKKKWDAVVETASATVHSAVEGTVAFVKNIKKKQEKPDELQSGEKKPKISFFSKKKDEPLTLPDAENGIEITAEEVQEIPAPEEKKKPAPIAAIGSFIGGVRNKIIKREPKSAKTTVLLPEDNGSDSESVDEEKIPETV